MKGLVESCAACRFWKAEPSEEPHSVEGPPWGWCRRMPPSIVDHMARMAIPVVGFGGNAIDPEDVATVVNVFNATLYPATYYTGWCGEFFADREASHA